MGAHLNCIDKYKEVDKKYTGYNLRTTKLLDCVLVGVCTVIRSNMVYVFYVLSKQKICRFYRKMTTNDYL